MDKWEKQHRAELAKIDKRIKAIYEAAAQEAAAIGVTIDGLTDELFRFSRFPLTHKRIDDLLQALHDRLQTAIINGVQSQWTLANNKNNELCRVVFGDNIGKLTKEQYKQYFSNNDAARDAFLARKEAGLGLSDRVWNYTDMFKTELEMGLDVGIRDGLPADVMARELKSYLQFPDKLFRRVRDEHGQLVLSQAAKAFHPGQGVYRSSFMNARRLAVTETNMAYRTADYERWQQLDFVVGIEVHLSGNHTAKGHKGVFIDICDELQGKYPKDFRFVGWHPFCRCYSTSILKTPAEMERDEHRIMQGKEPTEGSIEQVTDVPDGFKQWLSDNGERIERAKHLPYFLRNNGMRNSRGEYILKEFGKYQREKTPLDIAKERHAARTPQSVADIQARADERQKILKDYALTQKRASNILNMAPEWHEIDFAALQAAADTVATNIVYRRAQIDELKNALKNIIADIKAQQAAEKTLADIIPDVHKWHKQFTLEELQEVKKAVKKKIADYESRTTSLSKLEDNMAFEARWVRDHKKYSTWEVAESAYQKKRAEYSELLKWEEIDKLLAEAKIHGNVSKMYSNLVSQADMLRKVSSDAKVVEKYLLDAEIERRRWEDFDERLRKLKSFKTKSKKLGELVTEAEKLRKAEAPINKIEQALIDAESKYQKLKAGKRVLQGKFEAKTIAE